MANDNGGPHRLSLEDRQHLGELEDRIRAYFDRNLNPVYKQKQAYVRLTIEKQEDETVTTYYNAAGTVVKTDRK